MRLFPLMGLVAVSGCTGNSLCGSWTDEVAVVLGDFDNIAEPFLRADVRHSTFEGLISTAAWDDSFDPDRLDSKVEDLFVGTDGAGQLSGFRTVFVGSGTRGLGLREYNGLGADDVFLRDDQVADNLRRYLGRGGILFATDWSYDLVEAVAPEAIDFWGDDAVLDAAQRGMDVDITAAVVDEELAAALGRSELQIVVDYTDSVVIDGVSAETVVHMTGRVQVRPDATADPVWVDDVPLLVSFEPEDGGRIVLSTFHVDEQSAATMDVLIEYFVGSFDGTERCVGIE